MNEKNCIAFEHEYTYIGNFGVKIAQKTVTYSNWSEFCESEDYARMTHVRTRELVYAEQDDQG